jgi:hypothetical protein
MLGHGVFGTLFCWMSSVRFAPVHHLQHYYEQSLANLFLHHCYPHPFLYLTYLFRCHITSKIRRSLHGIDARMFWHWFFARVLSFRRFIIMIQRIIQPTSIIAVFLRVCDIFCLEIVQLLLNTIVQLWLLTRELQMSLRFLRSGMSPIIFGGHEFAGLILNASVPVYFDFDSKLVRRKWVSAEVVKRLRESERCLWLWSWETSLMTRKGTLTDLSIARMKNIFISCDIPWPEYCAGLAEIVLEWRSWNLRFR